MLRGLIFTTFILVRPLLADFEAGKRAYDQGDYAVALRELAPLADAGHGDAQWLMSEMYAEGKGVLEDHDAAIRLQKSAAEQGYAPAVFFFAAAAFSVKMYAEVVKLCTRLEGIVSGRTLSDEDRGSVAACELMSAVLYRTGEGVPKDDTESVKWLSKAAMHDEALAQDELGRRYYFGDGVVKDVPTAMTWFQKAAVRNNADSQSRLCAAYYVGDDGMVQDFSRAFDWCSKSAEHGDNAAELFLATMYVNGDGVPKDPVLAYMWANLAATSNKTEIVNAARGTRDKLVAKMSPEQIAKAQQLSSDWFERHHIPTASTLVK